MPLFQLKKERKNKKKTSFCWKSLLIPKEAIIPLFHPIKWHYSIIPTKKSFILISLFPFTFTSTPLPPSIGKNCVLRSWKLTFKTEGLVYPKTDQLWLVNNIFIFCYENKASDQYSGACFSKVPKLLRPISGATIPFISLQHQGSKPSNFTIILIFLTLKTC